MAEFKIKVTERDARADGAALASDGGDGAAALASDNPTCDTWTPRSSESRDPVESREQHQLSPLSE